ncbi:uncharacterized protein BDR25DRAFT_354580 [Lindgomyces ingoldianus]|uniref:Uncharacterized protein n=1 Tax=Lindgomyces ingoldianus TaxID=673940 RepID=A0ACB6QXN8_9PLEO|nr:uncharacterized protein BDR25DRAFT_354580 [Lindgomyces ingoldianus]KAF2471338.1 hypothetical protein BDR25DRAFT_354580 [Lindgomyces ingoldianus]
MLDSILLRPFSLLQFLLALDFPFLISVSNSSITNPSIPIHRSIGFGPTTNPFWDSNVVRRFDSTVGSSADTRASNGPYKVNRNGHVFSTNVPSSLYGDQ